MNDTVQGHQSIGGATKRGAPDPNVKPPDAVKAAADRANALVKQAQDAREAAPASDSQPLSATVAPPAERAPPTGVVMANFDPRNPNPPTDVPGAPSVSNFQAPQPQAPTPQSPEEWEHQFKSLKGRYDRDAEEKRNLARQLSDTQRLLANLSVAPQPAQGGPQEGSGVRFAPPPPPGRYITPEMRKEYGDEVLDVFGRRAQEVIEPIVAQLLQEQNQIKRQVGGVQNTVQYDAAVKMYDDLAKEVPNWDQINNSPVFAQWLDQPDPISGAVRRNLLNMAHNSNLAGRVIAIFKGFIADQASYGPAYAGQQPGNGAGYSASTLHMDLAQFAAPGRAKPGQTQVPPEKPIFNASDIPQFYRDKIAGKFAGREAEADALERALFLAGNEGRLRR